MAETYLKPSHNIDLTNQFVIPEELPANIDLQAAPMVVVVPNQHQDIGAIRTAIVLHNAVQQHQEREEQSRLNAAQAAQNNPQPSVDDEVLEGLRGQGVTGEAAQAVVRMIQDPGYVLQLDPSGATSSSNFGQIIALAQRLFNQQ